jgi:hypothetical protein
MLNFFFNKKRTKIENWEIQLIRSIINCLSDDFLFLKKQEFENQIKGVVFDDKFTNYVGFTYVSNFFKKYEDKKGRYYKLTGITFEEKESGVIYEIEIFIAFGIIVGYHLIGFNGKQSDFINVNVSKCVIHFLDTQATLLLQELFTADELTLINPSEVYEIIIDRDSYFHLKDLEDGNFIGIDRNKNYYKFTHDPFKITLLDGILSEIITLDS